MFKVIWQPLKQLLYLLQIFLVMRKPTHSSMCLIVGSIDDLGSLIFPFFCCLLLGHLIFKLKSLLKMNGRGQEMKLEQCSNILKLVTWLLLSSSVESLWRVSHWLMWAFEVVTEVLPTVIIHVFYEDSLYKKTTLLFVFPQNQAYSGLGVVNWHWVA